ncbi:unnamed protein product, partial [Protopolystoma xenopodis]
MCLQTKSLADESASTSQRTRKKLSRSGSLASGSAASVVSLSLSDIQARLWSPAFTSDLGLNCSTTRPRVCDFSDNMCGWVNDNNNWKHRWSIIELESAENRPGFPTQELSCCFQAKSSFSSSSEIEAVS